MAILPGIIPNLFRKLATFCFLRYSHAGRLPILGFSPPIYPPLYPIRMSQAIEASCMGMFVNFWGILTIILVNIPNFFSHLSKFFANTSVRYFYIVGYYVCQFFGYILTHVKWSWSSIIINDGAGAPSFIRWKF